MSAYTAPLADMRFVINQVADLMGVAALPGLEEATPDLVEAILEEAGKLGSEVLAPLNRVGDQQGCVLENGVVRNPEGFKEAYGKFVEGGWNGLPFDPEYGGQGLPWLVSTAVSEIWCSANMAFSLCPALTVGAVELLTTHGTRELKEYYLPRLITGEWNGTMNLTEPQAGSDLGSVRTKAWAVDPSDAAISAFSGLGACYRITGQKIFVTYGDHGLTDNIVHMVLARVAGGPGGVKGLSLFLVPKVLPGAGESLGKRNDIRNVSLEHKLGIHASPTLVLSYGDDGGAIGFLIGEEQRGIEYIFTMMNNARLGIGLEGVGIAERAYQHARAYAAERLQGRDVENPGGGSVAIDHHPDVRRMLLSMKARTEAMRALAYFAGSCLDKARRLPDPEDRLEQQALVDLLIPVVKAWSTDTGIDVANTGIQVHGGMGYIEETGAAQYLRDARIAAIYEGTNGIQALDLVGRKVARDEGRTALALAATIKALDKKLATVSGDHNMAVIRGRLRTGVEALNHATRWLVETYPVNVAAVAAGAVYYLHLLGTVTGGWLMARAALAADAGLAAGEGDLDFLRAKLVTARFYADHQLVGAPALATTFTEGGEIVATSGPELV